MTRVAAVGDIHVGADSVGVVRPYLEDVAEQADLLLLAGDLSRRGLPEEAEVVAGEVAGLGVPTIAVLGNHDLESGAEAAFRSTLEDHGIVVLEGDATVVDHDGVRVGVAGTVGFGGGFPGGTCADFGETEMKAFVARGRRLADALGDALKGLDTDLRIALTHYAPIRETLTGENPEIFPFLGSYLLAEAVDGARADLAVHGHAHHGVERGSTPGGVPVRNVAAPVIGAAYRVYELGDG